MGCGHEAACQAYGSCPTGINRNTAEWVSVATWVEQGHFDFKSCGESMRAADVASIFPVLWACVDSLCRLLSRSAIPGRALRFPYSEGLSKLTHWNLHAHELAPAVAQRLAGEIRIDIEEVAFGSLNKFVVAQSHQQSFQVVFSCSELARVFLKIAGDKVFVYETEPFTRTLSNLKASTLGKSKKLIEHNEVSKERHDRRKARNLKALSETRASLGPHLC